MKHDIDWSKCHNGLMLCSFDQVYGLMPEIIPILDELCPSLELSTDEYRVDVKIHMLMPNQYPCIPNWHCDFLPRDAEGNRAKTQYSPLKMYMWISGEPLTEYKRKDGTTYTKPANEWHAFTQKDLHRVTVSSSHTWRCFIRVIPTCFVHATTINRGQIRRHSQVYLDAAKFKW